MANGIKTIELDLDKEKELDKLRNQIKNKRVYLGKDHVLLRVLSNYEIQDDLYAAFLLLLSAYLYKEIRNNIAHHLPHVKSDVEFNNKLSEEFLRHHNQKWLQKEIEHAFKIQIEFEKKNPLNEVFGIWKNQDVSLDKIREKAWQRNN